MALPMCWLVRCGRPERTDWRKCGVNGQSALERLHLDTVYGRPLVVDQAGERRHVFRSRPYTSLHGVECYAFTVDCMQYYECDKHGQRVRMLWKTPAEVWQRSRKRAREDKQDQGGGLDGQEAVEYERVLAHRLRKRLKSCGKDDANGRQGSTLVAPLPEALRADVKGSRERPGDASDSSVVDGTSGDETACSS